MHAITVQAFNPGFARIYRGAVTIVLAVVLASWTSLARAEQNDDSADRLVAALLGETPMVSDLAELTDEIGGRPTGSAANLAAVDWALEKFKAAGIDAHKESVPMPRLWLEQHSSAMVTGAQISFAPKVVAMTFSPATSAGGKSATLLDAGFGTDEDFARLGKAAKGAYVLVSTKELVDIDGLFEEYENAVLIERRAAKAGVAGLVYMSSRPMGLLYRHNASLGPSNTITLAVMEREGAMRAKRLLRTGKALDLTLKLNIRDAGAYESWNVVADIKGATAPKEIVLVGAHLDSWGLGGGANDNGANAALVIDMARQIKRLGLKPRRTIRFVLWNGEEQGMYGSWAYTLTHRKELGQLVATTTIDIGSGRITGFFNNGHPEIRAALDAALAPVAGLGPFEHIDEAIVGTDNYDFMMQGVVNLVANQEAYNYGPNYHASSDTFDKVDTRQLRLNAAIMAAATYGLANSDARWKRFTKAQVQHQIDTTSLRGQMDLFNLYPGWKDGSRGWQN